MILNYQQHVADLLNVSTHSLLASSWKGIMDNSKVNQRIVSSDFSKGSVLDIGSGAGIPGIPIKFLNPHLKVQMIDATRKKTIFINKVSTKLELKDTCAHHGRAEDFAHNPQFRSQFC